MSTHSQIEWHTVNDTAEEIPCYKCNFRLTMNKIRRCRVFFAISLENGIHIFPLKIMLQMTIVCQNVAHFVRHKFMDLYTYSRNGVFVPEFDGQYKETRTKVLSLAFFLVFSLASSVWVYGSPTRHLNLVQDQFGDLTNFTQSTQNEVKC